MTVLIVNKKIILKGKNFNQVWQTINQYGVNFFLKEAEQDLIDNGIKYTIGEVEIKKENG